MQKDINTQIFVDFFKLDQLFRSDFNIFWRIGFLYDTSSDILLSLICESLNINSKLMKVLRSLKSWKEVQEFVTRSLEEYKKLSYVKFCVCTTASQITQSEKNKLQKSIEQIIQSPIYTHFVIDPKIIGGVILEIDDYTFDDSHRTILDQLEDRFVNKILQGEKCE